MDKMVNQKYCQCCGQTILKLDSTDYNWSLKKFCNRACKEKQRTRTRVKTREEIERMVKQNKKRYHSVYKKDSEYMEKQRLSCRRYQKENREREANRQRLRRKIPEVMEKHKVRAKTRYKYGPAPEGHEYHHLEPYSVDNFLIVSKEDHKVIHHG
ncbi:hypothetical protein CMI37_29235 [Candidatus Pacearchaeota archaeon]|jgi:hypothetical protein|nr:hypothetical protein [Candidatus Pacearchaeota archaeon]